MQRPLIWCWQLLLTKGMGRGNPAHTNMIDLILITFALCVFQAGIWCGHKYGNFKETMIAFKDWVLGLLS